jgi:hypothetical protein
LIDLIFNNYYAATTVAAGRIKGNVVRASTATTITGIRSSICTAARVSE